MLIKYLNIIIIIIIIIIFVNQIKCQSECPEGPNYYFEDSHCDSDFKYILKPTIYLYNFYQYTNITCTPDPIKQFINLVGTQDIYTINLENNLEYRCSLKNPKCSQDQIIQVSTSLGPQLIVNQPKCINSLASIDFSVASDQNKSDFEFKINGNFVSLPYEMLPLNSTVLNSFASINDGVERCKINFYVNQANIIQSYPNISISHATCNKGGKISIINFNYYQSISLYKSSGEMVQSKGSSGDGSGIFENLETDSYSIILVSNQCGKQSFEIQIENLAPNYKLNLLNDECPLKPKYQLVLDSQYSFNISIDGIKLGNPFTVQGDSNVTLNINSCGIFNIPIYRLYSIPPIHYTISNTSDFCNGIYLVHLWFNSTLVSNLKGSIKSSSNNSSTPLVINQDSTFNIVYSNQNLVYQLESNCFSEPIEIVAPSRKPHYEISKASTLYCNELVDIKILNYLDFTTLKLYLNGGDQYYQHVNGIFKNIPNQQYDIQFIYRNCSKDINSIRIGSKGLANVYFKSNIIKYPSCTEIQKAGLVEFTIYDQFTNNKIMNTAPQQFYYNNNNSIQYKINLDNLNCFANIIFNYTYQKLEYNIKVLKQPTCKYSNDGLIEISSNSSAIQNVFVNDQYDNSLNLNYQVSGGINKIEIKVFSPCLGDLVFYNVPPKYPDFDVSYDVTPVISCDSSNGSISIKDYQKYSRLLLDNQSLVNGSTGNTKDSRYYSLNFSIQLGNHDNETCNGSKQLYIPTSIDTDLQYRVVKQPLCHDSDGSIYFESIKDKDGKNYNIDLINGNEGNNYVNGIKVNGFTQNNNIFTIKSGTCSWNKQIDMQIASFNISIELVHYSVENCIGYATYIIKANRPYSTLRFNQDGLYFDYYTVNSIDGDRLIQISDQFDVCSTTITLKAIYPSIPNIKYKIQVNGDSSCLSSFTTINIQVENYLNYKSLKYNDVPINSNGYFINVRSGGIINAQLLNLDCKLYEKVQLHGLDSINIGKSILNETCFESLNGEIQINQDIQIYYYLIQNQNQQFTTSYYSLKSNNSISTFNLLGSQNVKIIKMNKLHPSCIQYELYNMGTTEPKINQNNEICSTDNSINFGLNKLNLNGNYYIYNSNSTLPSLSSSSSPSSLELNNLPNGLHNYSIQYTINTEYCKRILVSNISINRKDCNNNGLILKIVLPVGLFILVVLVAVTLIILYKKRLQSTKAKTIDPITHDYNSVKIFTGNKLQDIDKF